MQTTKCLSGIGHVYSRWNLARSYGLLCACLLALTIGCGELQVSDQCDNCPDKCATVDGKSQCVACVKDSQCRTAPGSTRRCTPDYRCVCGTDQDCSQGGLCTSEGKCVECKEDTDCSKTQFPVCDGEGRCQQCKPGETRPCAPRGVKTCGKGTQSCTTEGRWGTCEGLAGKVCRDDQECRGDRCACPAGSQECVDRCVDLFTDGKHCGACNNACPPGTRCAGRQCVKACPPETPKECGNSCVNPKINPRHCGACGNKCKPDEFCLAGKCSCPPGTIRCNDECIDPAYHPEHCGKCNNTCKDGKVCSSGACTNTCPISTPTNCFGGCMDSTNNAQHCGTCGQSCSSDKKCLRGTCQCPSGKTSCDSRCVDTKTHPGHCGGCNKRCASGQLCANGRCTPTCPSATPQVCLGGCYNIQKNSLHCGSCGNACQPGQICNKGKCECPAPLEACQGRCVDTRYHRLHCGGCGQLCPPGQFCTATSGTPAKGQCVAACPPAAATVCYGACVDLQSNPRHCGTCGTNCAPSQRCDAGSCVCNNGLTSCDQQCVDPKINPNHCGGCGNACKDGESCVDGSCTSACPNNKPLRCGQTCIDPKSDIGHCGKCNNNCATGEVCCAGQCAPKSASQPETCNGKDDNCNGQIDEGIQPKSCYTGPTGTAGKGSCKQGTQRCLAGSWTTCTGETLPFAPICDGKDNNCDGKIDTQCTWTTTTGSPDEDSATQITFDHLGHAVVVGHFQKTMNLDGKAYKSQGSRDAFIAKLDSKGKAIWVRTFGGAEEDRALTVTTDQTGHIYVGGFFRSTASIDGVSLTSKGHMDAFILKLDPSGKALWGFAGGGPERDQVNGLVTDSNGNAYAIGSYIKNSIFGTTTLQDNGFRNLFVLKLNATGTPVWVTWAGSFWVDDGRGIALDQTGHLYITGTMDDQSTFGTITGLKTAGEGIFEAFLAKMTTAKGKFLWVKQVKADEPAGMGVAVGSQGTIYMTGVYHGSLTDHKGTKRPAKGRKDIFVMAYDATGKALWTAVAGSSKDDVVHAIAVGNGAIHIAGSVDAGATFGTQQPSSLGKTDAFVASIDNSGNFTSVTLMGSNLSDAAFGVATSSKGGLLVSGQFQHQFQGRNANGLSDIFITRTQ